MKCKYIDHQVCIRTTGEYRLCCASLEEPNTENVKTHTPEEWLASEVPTRAREMLANNQWPAACIKCQQAEEAGLESMRSKPREYGPGISHLDLRFGNTCNLQCTMCHPSSSSSLHYEHEALLKEKYESPWGIHHYQVENWYDESSGELLSTMPDLREVYFAGGEPMMVKNLPKFLDKLDNHIMLRFSTNGTIMNPIIFNKLKRFRHVNLCFSLDGIGKVNDYIRWGSNWKEIEYNIEKYTEIADVTVSPTIQIMNALYYDELAEWCDKRNFLVYDNVLINPDWLHMKNAPDSLRSKFTRFSHWLTEPDLQAREKFVRYVRTLDKTRNCNIRDYIPEVADAYGIN